MATNLDEGSPEAMARQIRKVFHRHSICDNLLRLGSGKTTPNEEYLEAIGSSPSFRGRNSALVRQAGNRLAAWLSTAGFVKGAGPGWIFEDSGLIDLSFASRKGRDWGVFNGSAPPHRALELLREAMVRGVLAAAEIEKPGYQKALNVLSRFELVVQFENSSIKPVSEASKLSSHSATELLHAAAQRQPSVKETVAFLRKHPDEEGRKLASHLAAVFNENWAASSLTRTGNALRRWGEWLIDCEDQGRVIEPEKGTQGKPRGDTPEMMDKVHRMLDAGYSKKTIAKEVGYSVASIHLWLRKEARKAELPE